MPIRLESGVASTFNARVLIVDDEALFAELMGRSLSAEGGIEVVGVASDGEAAVEMANDLKPDAILMDIELPGSIDGIEAAVQIKRTQPETGVMILSSHSDRRYVTSLPIQEIPGWAYLLKQTVPDLRTLIRAI